VRYGEERLPLAQAKLAGLPCRGSILLAPVGSRLQVGDALPAKSCFASKLPELRRPGSVRIERQNQLADVLRPFPAPAVPAEDSPCVGRSRGHQRQGIEGAFAYRRRPVAGPERFRVEVALRPL